ncbi:MAG: hypothetical protein IKP65_00940 [Alphaproteobacteria bacterium]|nr:hypothetical protein [Alphaproteobacteria bacterium]
MLNESLSIANMLKNNIKNSMINNIYSISLLSSGRNSNFNVTTKNKSFVPFQYINPIVCGEAKCGSYKDDNLFFEFCN